MVVDLEHSSSSREEGAELWSCSLQLYLQFPDNLSVIINARIELNVKSCVKTVSCIATL